MPPLPLDTIKAVKQTIAIPLVLTVVSEFTDISEKLDSGADIINVSGGTKTGLIVRNIRKEYPKLPIIATGGGQDITILETINAGANAISYTPPTCGEMFGIRMEVYRQEAIKKHKQNES